MKIPEINQEFKTCNQSSDLICGGRREFLVKASAIAGGVVLSLSSALQPAAAQQDNKQSDNKSADAGAAAAAADDFVLKLDDKSALSRIGGFETVETTAGKVVIVRRAEMSFSAYSAVCTHKGGPIKYDEKAQNLYCPWHNSHFDLNGQVTKGPAKSPLKVFVTQEAVVLSLKPKE